MRGRNLTRFRPRGSGLKPPCWSLRIQFDGKQNVGDIGVRQTVYLKPVRYQLQAYVRAQGISTDEGVRFRVSSESVPNRLSVSSEAVSGTTDWKLIKLSFSAPPGGELVEIRLARTPSLRFDNFIRGTLWVDQVSIRPESVGGARSGRVAADRSK